MRITNERRGFHDLVHNNYPSGGDARVAGESSAIGEYDDSFDRPGSSYLWIGEHHHLNRKQVTQLRDALTNWLNGKRLTLTTPETETPPCE